MKREKPASGTGARQPLLTLPSTMPDGKRTKLHPLLWCIQTLLPEPDTKSDLARYLGVKPQSLYKWEMRCRKDRHFPLPVVRAAQLGTFFDVAPSLFRPDVFKGAA